MHDFSERTLVLSGAAGGIGRRIAIRFFKAGANLMLGDVNLAALKSLVEYEFAEAPERVAVFELDAGSSASNAEFARAAADSFGTIDFLVLGAAIHPQGKIATMSDSEWDRVMQINLDSCFYLCKAAIPALSSGASIVGIASQAGHRGSKVSPHYAATKGAMIALVRSLAWELGPDVRANAVSPGVIKTPMTADMDESHVTALHDQTPLRLLGSSDEVASVIEFLCSDDASFVNGEVIHVNGGLYMA